MVDEFPQKQVKDSFFCRASNFDAAICMVLFDDGTRLAHIYGTDILIEMWQKDYLKDVKTGE